MRDWIAGLIGAAVIIAAALLISAWPAHAQTTPAPAAHPPPPSPIVQLGDMNGAHCTAFFLGNPNIVISAGHCFFHTEIPLDQFRILPIGNIPPDGLLPVKLAAASNPDAGLEDWAIFRIQKDVPEGWKGVTLDCHYVPHLGAEVSATGFPAANGRMTLMRGYINGEQSIFGDGGEGLIPVTMSVSGGASGSPVFEPDGRVIGILTDENDAQDGWAYFQPITPICNALHIDGAHS